MPRRVLLVTHFYPPGHLGGTEVLTSSLAKELTARGHDVQVLCAEDWDRAPSHRIVATDDHHEDVAVRRLHFNWTKAPDVFRSLYANPEVEAYLTAYLHEHRPDIVHITSCYALSASVIAAADRAAVPTLLTATDFWFLCARNTLLQDDESLCSGPETPWKCARCHSSGAKIYRWPRTVMPEPAVAGMLLQLGKYPLLTNQPGLRGMLGDWDDRQRYLMTMLGKVNHVVTASQFLHDQFVRYGADAEQLEVSSYGLDTSWAHGYTTKRPSNELRIGFIGQILPFKGPDLLLKAVADLGRDLPLRVSVYGDLEKTPAYGEELRRLAGDDPRIRFKGTFDNSRMGEVLSEIDLLVVPSTWYDFPLVIPSALATSTPVLTTNLPGMNEAITHERNGLLFERHDWQGLAAQIRRLLDEPGLLGRLRAGITPVKTIAEMADEYLERYAAIELAAAAQPLPS